MKQRSITLPKVFFVVGEQDLQPKIKQGIRLFGLHTTANFIRLQKRKKFRIIQSCFFYHLNQKTVLGGQFNFCLTFSFVLTLHPVCFCQFNIIFPALRSVFKFHSFCRIFHNDRFSRKSRSFQFQSIFKQFIIT